MPRTGWRVGVSPCEGGLLCPVNGGKSERVARGKTVTEIGLVLSTHILPTYKGRWHFQTSFSMELEPHGWVPANETWTKIMYAVSRSALHNLLCPFFLVLVSGKAHFEGSHVTGWKDPGSLSHCSEESSPEYPPALHQTVLWATYYICKALIVFQCWLMATRLPSLKDTSWVVLPGNALVLAILYSYWALLTCAYTPESITDSVLAVTLGHMPVSSGLTSSHEQIPGPAQGQHNSGHADITAH